MDTRLIDVTTNEKISLAELVELLETGDFDPADEDNFASWGIALRKLANDRTFLGDPPGVHHEHPIAGLGDDRQVVRDQDE